MQDWRKTRRGSGARRNAIKGKRKSKPKETPVKEERRGAELWNWAPGKWLMIKVEDPTKLTRRCWELTQIKSGRRNHLGSVVDDQQLTSPLASLPPNFQLDVWRRLASSRNCTAFAPPSTVPFRLMNLFFSFWSAPTRWSHCFHLLLAPCRS